MATTQNKIAILVGAGAVENAWEPILTMFRPINCDETDPDTANFLFAKSICALRLYSKLAIGAKQLRVEQQTVSLMKEVICDLLTIPQKTAKIKSRKEFEAILNKFVLANPNNLFGLVSTNWNTVIDAEADRWVKEKYYDIESAKVFHIHGSIAAHEQLYLVGQDRNIKSAT